MRTSYPLVLQNWAAIYCQKENGQSATSALTGHDLERSWDHPSSPVTLKKRILRTVLEEIVADTTDDPPTVHLKLHWAGGVHTELAVRKNRTGHHDQVNSQEATELIRELAPVCEDSAIVSILNRLGYRTRIGNTWTEKRVQHVRHTKSFPACPPLEVRRWITMQQAASAMHVSDAVVRRLVMQKTLPARQIVRFASWMIERAHLDLPAVHRAIRLVHTGRRDHTVTNTNVKSAHRCPAANVECKSKQANHVTTLARTMKARIGPPH